MTLAEMLTECDLRIDEANAPWFTDAEKLRYLNDATLSLVRQRYEEGYDTNESIRQDLANLTEPGPITMTQVGTTPEWRGNIDAVTTPIAGTTVMFVLALSVTSTLSGASRTVGARAVRIAELDGIFQSPFLRPSQREPKYYITHDGTTNTARRICLWMGSPNQTVTLPVVTGATLIYLRTPRAMAIGTPNTESELPAHIHPQIISLAVTRMLESVESARTPGFANVQDDRSPE